MLAHESALQVVLGVRFPHIPVNRNKTQGGSLALGARGERFDPSVSEIGGKLMEANCFENSGETLREFESLFHLIERSS